MNVRSRLAVLLSTVALALGGAVAIAPAASAAPAVVNNYCRQPVYAPNGTNKPVRLIDNLGHAVNVPCGSGRGNTYLIRTLYPTRIVWSSGGSVCWRAGNSVYAKTNARVYTVPSC